MDEQRIRQIIKDEMNQERNTGTYNTTGISRHVHNGVDAPFVFDRTVSYSALINADGNPIPNYPFPLGWTIDHGDFTLRFTGAFAGGETSGTLTTPWTDENFTELLITFSNADQRTGTFTVGSTAVTWSGALSGVATAVATTSADGVYYITHNLDTTQYTVVVNPINDATLFSNFCAATVITAKDLFGVFIFDTATQTLQDLAFCVVLVQINNTKTVPPLYTNS